MPPAKRELFKSPDVCEMAQLQPYVLRSWESEFPGLGQPAPAGGGRVYRRSDVEMVLRIKQLVFGEGLTLAGARRRLEEEPADKSVAAVAVADVLGDMARSKLRQVRTGLEAILRLLSRDAEAQTELQLVPPASGSLRSRTRPAASSTRAVSASRRPAKSSKATAGKRRRAS
jgi:DNA-binding transcriptional MerR regulator